MKGKLQCLKKYPKMGYSGEAIQYFCMNIAISFRQRQIQLSPLEQSLAQTAASRKLLKDQFRAQLVNRAIAYSAAQTLTVAPDALKLMVRKYSEQLVYQPLEEMRFWFTYSNGVFLEPGYPPLYYSRKSSSQSVSPNKSAIASIGEGVAGLVAQQLYRARKLARPIHDYPDLVMANRQTIYLIEAKATTGSGTDIQHIIDEELSRMSVYTSGCANLASQNQIVGVVIGTALTNINVYETFVTEVWV